MSPSVKLKFRCGKYNIRLWLQHHRIQYFCSFLSDMPFLCKYVFVRECRATHIAIQYSGLFLGIKFCLVFRGSPQSMLSLSLGFIPVSGFAVFFPGRYTVLGSRYGPFCGGYAIFCLCTK